MYNLNVNVAPGAAGLLAVEGSCTTPKTPEILNSLIAMTSPFDAFPGAPGRASGPRAAPGGSPSALALPSAGQPGGSGSGALSPTGDSCSSSSSCSGPLSSHGSTAGTPPLGSPTGAGGSRGGGGSSPPSVQHTCSQLIKEGLKLTIQSKRRQTGRDPLDPLDLDGAGPAAKHARRDELTAEDEERRRRRRERNKIAATKCRLKKRERTVNLVHESEILETQNHELKNQIQDLETQRRRLMEMLSMHSPTCLKNNGAAAGGAAGPSQLSPPSAQGPGSATTAPFCADLNAPNHHHQASYCDPYHSYGPVSCSFGGGYAAAGGVDNGCMA
ncbi:hypothetical protein R5R35_000063 [Gryllus longicercus]|uniref:BZIP domain-containing protein n=1 Tax=Gryllus longicercus TaxID=2509291 RepID=A0AAN9VKW8_9ORTH